MFRTNTRGFTLIELLVVIAIIGILSSIVLASLNTARTRARDAQRLSDVRELVKLINLSTDAAAVPVATCVAADALTNTCTGPGDISQFANFNDPSGTAACTSASTGVCNYAISQADGSAAATTEDYQICFWLEGDAGGLSAGLNSVTGPSGNFVADCN